MTAPEPYTTHAPPCPECGGPADTGAGHDCEPDDDPYPLPARERAELRRAADRAAYARETDAIYAREARRARDYDDGIIADDDH